MSAIRTFLSGISQQASRLGYLVDTEELIPRYVEHLSAVTQFDDINFDYLTTNYDRRPVFAAEEWEKMTEIAHRHILNLCQLAVPNFRRGLEDALFPSGIKSDHAAAIWREAMPSSTVAEDFFPFPALRDIQKGILTKAEEYLNNPNITDIIIDAPTGCVHADTVIVVIRDGNPTRTTIKEEWLRQEQEGSARTEVRGLDGTDTVGSITSGGIVHSGHQKCIRLVSESGKSIVLTPDHRVYLGDGEWCRADEMLGRYWLVDSGCQGTLRKEKVTRIEEVGICEVFDVINTPSESFTANDIVVHNSGKSGIAIALLLRFGAGYIGTANKNLQNQYTTEFPWLADLRGRANYNCNVHLGSNCRNSPCQTSAAKKKECSQNKECDYHTAQANAFQRHRFTLMNMHTLVAYSMFAEGLVQEREVLIIDEAHSFPEVISSSVGMTIMLRKISKYGVREIPKFDTAEYYREWLTDLERRVKTFVDEDEEEDQDVLADDENDAGFHHKILFCLKELNNDNLAISHDMDPADPTVVATLRMHPIRVADYYKKICAKAPIRIHLSATILAYETYCDMLGIKKENVGVMRAGCPFPKENRPIIMSHAVGHISRANLEYCIPDMVKNIQNIMDHYPDSKGIIHGTTYYICNSLYNKLPAKYKSRVLYARTAKEQSEALFKHKNSKNTVLLSPSMTEGVDLKDDMSRYQILAKTPYPYLGDPLIQKRKELFKGYYEMLTAITLLQSYGRSVRNDRDWCHTYVLDKNFGTFIQSNPHLFPTWFTEAIHW